MGNFILNWDECITYLSPVWAVAKILRLRLEILQDFLQLWRRTFGVHCRTAQNGVKHVTRCTTTWPFHLELKSPVSERIANYVSSLTNQIYSIWCLHIDNWPESKQLINNYFGSTSVHLLLCMSLYPHIYIDTMYCQPITSFVWFALINFVRMNRISK